MLLGILPGKKGPAVFSLQEEQQKAQASVQVGRQQAGQSRRIERPQERSGQGQGKKSQANLFIPLQGTHPPAFLEEVFPCSLELMDRFRQQQLDAQGTASGQEQIGQEIQEPLGKEEFLAGGLLVQVGRDHIHGSSHRGPHASHRSPEHDGAEDGPRCWILPFTAGGLQHGQGGGSENSHYHGIGQHHRKQDRRQEPYCDLALHGGPDESQAAQGDPVIQPDPFPGKSQQGGSKQQHDAAGGILGQHLVHRSQGKESVGHHRQESGDRQGYRPGDPPEDHPQGDPHGQAAVNSEDPRQKAPGQEQETGASQQKGYFPMLYHTAASHLSQIGPL